MIKLDKIEKEELVNKETNKDGIINKIIHEVNKRYLIELGIELEYREGVLINKNTYEIILEVKNCE